MAWRIERYILMANMMVLCAEGKTYCVRTKHVATGRFEGGLLLGLFIIGSTIRRKQLKDKDYKMGLCVDVFLIQPEKKSFLITLSLKFILLCIQQILRKSEEVGVGKTKFKKIKEIVHVHHIFTTI